MGRIPRTVCFIAAVISAVVGALAFSGGAGANHVQGEEPYFTCRASVARATLLDGQLLPSVEPLAANSNREECAEDEAGAPNITLPPPATPPPPVPPFVFADVVRATTEILCADDNPDPSVSPENNDACDAGRRSFEQQVHSTADASNVRISLGGAQGVPAPIEITAQAANTSADARCGPGNVPLLSSKSNVLNIVLTVGGVNVPIQPFAPDEEVVIDLPLDLGRLTLNEVDVTPAGQQVNAAGDFVFADAAAEGQITRRAIHLEVPGGAEPGSGSIADVIVAESIADFHGDVCPEGKVVIKKETAPDENPNSTAFNFASPGLTPASFDLTDDGSRTFDEVQPATYAVTEGPPANEYVLTLINCADNRTDNSTVDVGARTANVNVGPGETVTCTFVNAKPPEGVCPTGSKFDPVTKKCIIEATECPAGSKLVGSVCVIEQTTCPSGSRPVGNQCVNENVVCPPGFRLESGQCVAENPVCPPGSQIIQGRCVISNVQCPAGTTFNPTTLGCTEAPRGGTLVPLLPQVTRLFPGSPCIGQGFGLLVGIIGTNGPDRITGTNASDRIFALGGNDRVSGGRGDDCVEGGSGRDVLDGSNGNDFLLGGTGNDRVSGGPGRDRFSGGSGRDVLSGGNSADVILGGGGRDRLQGGYGNDRLVGGSGNDGIHTGNGRDRVSAGSGNDIINAATVGPAAFVDCGPGKDRVRINRNERRRTRNCEFIDVPRRIRSQGRTHSPR